MKITDYARIADRYDKNPYRVKEISFDHDLDAYISHNRKSEYEVLDLSCGTGLYLEKQMKLFDSYQIKWYGMDLSEQMLNKAKEKVENVEFIQANVEDMPFQSEKFDFISNNYAFHHYIDKGKALNGIHRILKKGSVYKLHNIAIHEMTKWWVYHYFPSAYAEDIKRFWTKEKLFDELHNRGYEAKIRIEYRMEQVRVKDYLHHAENRDISVLTLIDDTDYVDGLERIKYDLKKNPNKTIVNEFAEIFSIAKKG